MYEGDRAKALNFDELEPSVQIKFLFFRMKTWWLIVLALQVVILVLMLTALGSDRWVEQGQTKGALLHLAVDEKAHYESMSYSKLSRDLCDADEDSGLCEDFERLQVAGVLYVLFNVPAYCLTLVWMVKTSFSLIETWFLKPVLAYVWPGAGLFLHLLATLVWFSVAPAGFWNDCEDTGDEFCTSYGPVVAVIVIVIYSLTAGLYVLLYLKREGETPSDDAPRHSAEQLY